MNKQYLLLNLESATFNNMKSDFNELLQELLKKLHAGKISEGSITMKLSVSLEEVMSPTVGKAVTVPMFKHKTRANYTETLENGGAVSLPNMYLEYDSELGEFVMRPAGGEQDMFAEQDTGGAVLQLRDPLCNDCGNRDSAYCEHCEGGESWEPRKE